MGSVGDKVADIFDSVKNMELTMKQSPKERMAVFTDDYVSPNYTPPSLIRKRKQSKIINPKKTHFHHMFS